jgi:protein TonB
MGTPFQNPNSIDEVVFENRNKHYGAYQIRKSYDDSLIKSFGLAMISLLALIAIYRFMPEKTVLKELVKNDPGTIITDWKPPVTKQLPPPAHPEPTPPAPKANANVVPVVIDSTEIKPVEKPTNQAPVNGDPGAGNPANPGPTGEPGTGNPGTEAYQPPLQPIEWADTMPEFPGGEAALFKYMNDHIRYTSMASEAGVKGKIVMQFVVDETGMIKDIVFRKKLGYGLEEQATSVVRSMPRWKPGKMHGRSVAVWHTQPITYQIQ